MLRKIIILNIVLFSMPLAALSQENFAKFKNEVIAFREKIRIAIEKKDQPSLQAFFADGFNHTHASGKLDDKKARIERFLSGEPTIDSVKPTEFEIRIAAKNLAVVIGKSLIIFAEGEEARKFQWSAVYYKNKGKMQVICSSAVLLK